jgi:hypothetical protein
MTEENTNDTAQRIETVSRTQILAILDAQGYRCALTGWKLTPETASIDHVQPLSRGGDHVVANAQIVDWRVNAAKGTLTNEEFVEMCLAVASNQAGIGKTETNNKDLRSIGAIENTGVMNDLAIVRKP